MSNFFCTFAAVYGLQKKRYKYMAKKKTKEEEIDPIVVEELANEEDVEEWELEGFESKEEYDDYCAKSAEDPLYGYGDLVTIKEMKELLKQEPYIPKGEDAKYPAELLLDEKTGMYYTDFFRDYRTHMLLGHILAIECIVCDNLDWERVTGGYSPYALARINDLCLNVLEWKPIPQELVKNHIITGRYAEEDSGNTPFSDDALWEFANQMQVNRAVWFAEHLPTGNDLYAMRSGYVYTRSDMIQWDIITSSYDEVDIAVFDDKDPYHIEKEVLPWSTNAFIENLTFIKEKLGYYKASEVARLLRRDWPLIVERKRCNIDKVSEEEIEEFRRFLFKELELIESKWSTEEYYARLEQIENHGKKSNKSANEEDKDEAELYKLLSKVPHLELKPTPAKKKAENKEKPASTVEGQPGTTIIINGNVANAIGKVEQLKTQQS